MIINVTGYKRSLTIVIGKQIDGNLAPGYPKQYPTATDIANGYFTLFGNQYAIPTAEELGYLSQAEYDLLLIRFKQYVLLNEPGLSFSQDIVNSPEIYAPEECYQITTTTTPIPVTTTTTEELVTTTTAEEIATTITTPVLEATTTTPEPTTTTTT